MYLAAFLYSQNMSLAQRTKVAYNVYIYGNFCEPSIHLALRRYSFYFFTASAKA